jgi:hypothetical protein
MMGRDVKLILAVKGGRIMMKGGKIMERSIKRILAVLASVFLIMLLFSCGGGGGGTTTGGGTTSSTLSGTAATGKPLVYVPVHLKDSKGNTRSTITDAKGKFSFDTTDLTPPFYLKIHVYDPFSYYYDLFSYTDQKSGTANITPLSTAVVAVANNGNADIYTNPPSQLNLSNVKDFKNFLNPVLQKYGVQNADFITTPFDANGQGMDAVLDSIIISVNTTNKTIEIKNPFTGDTIGKVTLSNGSVRVDDSINDNEVNNLPQSVTSRKYFAYIKDNYGSPEDGPRMIDIVDVGNGKISVTITATEGDTGDIFFIYGDGTKSGNSISFTASVIMCHDTSENGTGTAVFSGTIDSNGNITGTFTNTLSAGDTCKENDSNIYEGTFTAENVTNASPTNVAGTYNGYVTPSGWTEEGPATLQIAQNGSSINVSITAINGDTGQPFTRSGQGIVYGNYVMFRVPIIMCHDTNANAEAEYATFFGKFDSKTNTISGIYGDGIPPGDSCREGSAEGFWRAVKK